MPDGDAKVSTSERAVRAIEVNHFARRGWAKPILTGLEALKRDFAEQSLHCHEIDG